jgi:adenylylsulfate kinase-like enzyme
MLQTHDPMAILLLGIGGTGKSTTSTKLVEILRSRGHSAELICMDQLRQELAPSGTDPFSSDPIVKHTIYERACTIFEQRLNANSWLVIDSGLSVESIRRELRLKISQLRIVHVHCPLIVAVWRDTKRSMLGRKHERGRYLHLHAIIDRINPFKAQKFPQPGITYSFEFPASADLHINTFLKSPLLVAREIVNGLRIMDCG